MYCWAMTLMFAVRLLNSSRGRHPEYFVVDDDFPIRDRNFFVIYRAWTVFLQLYLAITDSRIVWTFGFEQSWCCHTVFNDDFILPGSCDDFP